MCWVRAGRRVLAAFELWMCVLLVIMHNNEA